MAVPEWTNTQGHLRRSETAVKVWGKCLIRFGTGKEVIGVTERRGTAPAIMIGCRRVREGNISCFSFFSLTGPT